MGQVTKHTCFHFMQLSGSLVLIYYYYDNCVAITELVDQWDSY